jgi:2-polyprenyl-6-methoxyphenol hydroxylase-like FAD-dependent oxidoreductase
MIGAELTGLMMARQLARYGIDFIIADIKSKPTSKARAELIIARSIQFMNKRGWLKRLLSKERNSRSS